MQGVIEKENEKMDANKILTLDEYSDNIINLTLQFESKLVRTKKYLDKFESPST